MTVEYIVLGAVIIVTGAVQIWLRHGAKDEDGAPGGAGSGAGRRGVRSGRVWEGWTAILGFVGVGLGIVLVVLGVLGR